MTPLDALHRALAKPLEVARPNPQVADAIVVLGSPTAADGTLTSVGLERVAVGVELFRLGLAPRFICTGRGEAEPMIERAIALGVANTSAIAEGNARTTDENARYCAELLAPGATVWLVSQPFHVRRGCYLFRRYGLKPLPFYAADSIQYASPSTGLRWASREYLAWAHTGLTAGLRRLRGC